MAIEITIHVVLGVIVTFFVVLIGGYFIGVRDGRQLGYLAGYVDRHCLRPFKEQEIPK